MGSARFEEIENFRWCRGGFSLPVLCTLDPLLSLPSTTAEKISVHMSDRGGKKHWQHFWSNFSPFQANLRTFRFFGGKPYKINSQGGSKARRRRKNAVNSGHLVPWERTQATRTKITRIWPWTQSETESVTENVPVTELKLQLNLNQPRWN